MGIGLTLLEKLLEGKPGIEHQAQAKAADLFGQFGEAGGLCKRLTACEGHPVEPPGLLDPRQQLRGINLTPPRRIMRLRVVAAGAAVRAALEVEHQAQSWSVDNRFRNYPGQPQLHCCSRGAKWGRRSFSSSRFASLKRSSVER